MAVLRSRHNAAYKALVRLVKRRDLMVLEGLRLVQDALERGFRPHVLAVSERFMDSAKTSLKPDLILAEDLFDTLAETKTPQGIMAVFDIPWAEMDDVLACDRVVVLDGVQDPGNVGTIVRTAEAFGFEGVVALGGTANPFSPKAVRASMGSCLGVKVARAAVDDVLRMPHLVAALSLDGTEDLRPLLEADRLALCLGQEARGVSSQLAESASCRVKIPMRGPTESLNVAVAAGIVMALASGVLPCARREAPAPGQLPS